MNLVILGISSTRTGLIPKDWYINDDIAQWSFSFISYFEIGGGLLEFGPFMAHSGEFQSTRVIRPPQTYGAISASLEVSDLPSSGSSRGLQERV